MGNQAEILTALKAAVDGVANIGKTYSRQRYVADWANYLTLFKATIGGTDQIRGWMLMPDEANAIVGERDQFSGILRTYNVLIVGFLGLDDSADTEGTLAALCEGVIDAIDALSAPSGVTGAVGFGCGPCTVKSFQVRQFGSVLCNYAEISVPVQVTKAI